MIDSSAVPGARFVDPKVLARIGNLELVARSVVDGFINGLHRSPFFGASVDMNRLPLLAKANPVSVTSRPRLPTVVQAPVLRSQVTSRSLTSSTP